MGSRSDAEKVEYLGSGPRLDVALQCLDAGKTRDQIAAGLDRAPGGLSAPNTLLREGALERVGSRAVGGGGELLRVSRAWRRAVLEAASARHSGHLEPGSDILLVGKRDVQRAADVLRHTRAQEDIAWAADVHGDQMGLIVCPAMDPSGVPTVRLLGALGDAGVHVAEFRIGEIRNRTDFARWIAAVAKNRPELP